MIKQKVNPLGDIYNSDEFRYATSMEQKKIMSIVDCVYFVSELSSDGLILIQLFE